ncbi:MAG: hypothetical protein ABIE84_05035 [bacterium]
MFKARPPIKYYSPNPGHVGVGNKLIEGNKTTDRGQAFWVTMANYIHGAPAKLIAQGERLTVAEQMAPGMVDMAAQDQWDFIEYIGKSAKDNRPWDLSVVDTDLNGTIDTLESTETKTRVPFLLYQDTTQPAAQARFDTLLEEIEGSLSSGKTFVQAIQDESAPSVDDGAGCLAYLTALLQTWRNWNFAMSVFGLDATNINCVDENGELLLDENGKIQAIANFEKAMEVKFEPEAEQTRFEEAGGLNSQVFLDYLKLNKFVAIRFEQIMQSDWMINECLPGAQAFYAEYAAVEMQPHIDTFTSKTSNFQNHLTNLAGATNQQDIEYSLERMSLRLSEIPDVLNEIKSAAEYLGADFLGLDEAVEGLAAETTTYLNTEPAGTITEGVDLTAKLAAAEGVMAKFAEVQGVLANFENIVTKMSTELASTSLANEYMKPELYQTIMRTFFDLSEESINYFSNIINLSMTYQTMNRVNSRKYQRDMDLQYEESKADSKQEGKREAISHGGEKAERQKTEKRVSSQAIQKQKAENKYTPKPKNNETQKPKPKTKRKGK